MAWINWLELAGQPCSWQGQWELLCKAVNPHTPPKEGVCVKETFQSTVPWSQWVLVASEVSVVTRNLYRSYPEMCHAHTEPQMILEDHRNGIYGWYSIA